MAETKHTPGPWTLDRYGHVTESTGEKVLFSGTSNTLGNHPEQATAEANTRLIAAAPDLLDALTGVLDAVPYSEEWREATFAARRAIAKAEGR